jgi:ABC-2 type transport system ATP-binding protein
LKTIIDAKNLTKTFNKTIAVNNVSFKVFENEIFGLLGPNGSGKTTTQRMLSTTLKPTSGKLQYYSQNLNEKLISKVRKRIGLVPQGDCLYKDLTVEENIRLFAYAYNKKYLKNIDSIIELLELEEKRKTLVKNLSGGLAKRASIATALIHNPKILFLDEVTMGLDPNSRYHIWQLIKQLKKNTTIILTTHYMDEAEDLCDRIAILSQGNLLDVDKPEKILLKNNCKNLNQVLGKIIKKEK